jgi:hypothetical protein
MATEDAYYERTVLPDYESADESDSSYTDNDADEGADDESFDANHERMSHPKVCSHGKLREPSKTAALIRQMCFRSWMLPHWGPTNSHQARCTE